MSAIDHALKEVLRESGKILDHKAGENGEGTLGGAIGGAGVGFLIGGPIGAGIGAIIGGAAGAEIQSEKKHDK